MRDLQLLGAGVRRPDRRDDDQYDGVELRLVLAYLRGAPVEALRLDDDAALQLAAELVEAVRRRRRA